MKAIMSDTNMIQNKTEEYGYILKIEESPHKKNIPKQTQKDNRHHLVGCVVICTLQLIRETVLLISFSE